MAYNRKCKYPLKWTKLYEKNVGNNEGLDIDTDMDEDEGEDSFEGVAKKNKQTDGSTRNRPFVILSWKGKGRAHILYRSSAEFILSGQLFPVSGYCFADLLCSLFRFLRARPK